jgi:hypothetical protein
MRYMKNPLFNIIFAFLQNPDWKNVKNKIKKDTLVLKN